MQVDFDEVADALDFDFKDIIQKYHTVLSWLLSVI